MKLDLDPKFRAIVVEAIEDAISDMPQQDDNVPVERVADHVVRALAAELMRREQT